MLRRILSRRISYDPKKNWKPLHSDNRDVYNFTFGQRNNVDSAFSLSTLIFNLKHVSFTWAVILSSVLYVLYKSKSMRRKFDINFLTQLPTKDFEPSDYDYKFWEVVLSTPHPKFGASLTTDTASKDNYVLLYLGSIKGAHIPMQRFSRLQRFIEQRKAFPLVSVFVSLDTDCEPETLYHYANTYSQEMLSAFLPSQEAIDKIKDVFQNIGCVYILEKNSGNVIGIIDPGKHPLETLSNKANLIISKYEDLKLSRQVVANKIDIRLGQQGILEYKPPTY